MNPVRDSKDKKLRQYPRLSNGMRQNEFDIIVVGAGHAGIEASHATAKMGARTALITLSKDTIGQMSCNPAIGGLAKGQIVREIDSLGGLMALAIDSAGIQFRMLNRSKGPAVQSPRAQADRQKYQDYMRQALEATENLTIIEAKVTAILTENKKFRGVVCSDGSFYYSQSVILTPGTFLGGKVFIGSENWPAGRINEPPSIELSQSLQGIGLNLGRMATDTTPRLDAKSCRLDKLQPQPGDEPACGFSFLTERIEQRQVPCWITHTNAKIHQLLRDNMNRAALSTGQIQGADPRYCPSIESKVVRFEAKSQHRIILEPEQQSVETIYCNGIFTSMPKDVQEELLRLLPGTEKARIVRYAYAIEYDFCPPVQLKNNLETKKISGLFLAGQINGTSGYEEAAGQGIMAGINAVRKLQNKEPVILGRDQAYIGVLIDDLLTKEITEPYRMFTSRAEYRLSLRADNADRRLTPIGREVGLVDDERWKRFERKVKAITELKDYMQSKRAGGESLWEKLKKPSDKAHEAIPKGMNMSEEVLKAVTIDAKYSGYLIKQQKLVEGFHRLEHKQIPEGIDYNEIEHLKAEAREKLSSFRPATLAQALRIAGITPADITVIQIYLKKHSYDNSGQSQQE